MFNCTTVVELNGNNSLWCCHNIVGEVEAEILKLKTAHLFFVQTPPTHHTSSPPISLLLTYLPFAWFKFSFPTQYADADAQRKSKIEAVNTAESVIHDTEKNLQEFKDSIEGSEADGVKAKIQELRQTLQSDANADEIKAKMSEVQQTSLKLFEVAYKKRAGSNAGSNTGSSDSSSSGKENVQDADFQDVNDKKKK